MVVCDVGVVGANGKTGRAVTAALRMRGATVRPIGRAQLVDPVGALRGCGAIYLIAPNMYAEEPAFVDRILAAAATVETPQVVYHSVATPYTPLMPHHMGKVISEDRIRRGPCSWTILQPCPYVQNFLPALRAPEPALRVAYDVTKSFNFVDLHDVAEAAAIVLLDSGHLGATYELGGPDLMSVSDLAAVAQTLLRREVPVGRIDPDHWSTTQGASLEPRVRDWLLAMFDYYDHYGLLCGGLPLRALLDRNPTDVRSTLLREF